MTVIFGYELKDYIKNDEEVINYINESYKKANEEHVEYSYIVGNIDISTIFVNVEKVGEVHHGVLINVPKTINLKALKTRISEIIRANLNEKVEIYIEENSNKYKIYIECENVITQAIDEYAELNYGQSIDELYTLFKDK